MLTKLWRLTMWLFFFVLFQLSGSGWSLTSQRSNARPPMASSIRYQAVLGDVDAVGSAYQRWTAQHRQAGGDRNVLIPVGWAKGLSAEFTLATGQVTCDLIGGTVAVEVKGLEAGKRYDVWLIDNKPGPGRSLLPDRGDTTVNIGTLAVEAATVQLEASLPDDLPKDFQLDLVVISWAGEAPERGGVLFGAPTLFGRMYTRSRLRGLQQVSVVHSMDALVATGEQLFFNETFSGNGRTCGTCHPAENNLTIDPAFIATLPPRDPLFVAEFIPALKENFEKPELMNKLGLILENTDGFDDLENRFTMRGVPHVLALATSLNPSPIDGTTNPPVQRTGWSGDGSPGDGSLRLFAVGAVVQHFPLTLDRQPGVDFRLPNDDELDALEAFQLSLGRQDDLDLQRVTFKGEVPARGKALFLNEGQCNFCHANAGANSSFRPQPENLNFNTGVENLPDQPADLIDPANNPPDGGFGRAPNPSGGFGNGTFNTPVLVEAADTGPFFHNNSVSTIEGAVAFYNSDAFNSSPSAQPIGGIDLEATQVEAIAAFLRVLNATQNIRSAWENERRAVKLIERVDRYQRLSISGRRLLKLAIVDLEDAIAVLRGGGLHSEAVALLAEAVTLDRKALHACSRTQIIHLIRTAIKKKRGALELLVEL